MICIPEWLKTFVQTNPGQKALAVLLAAVTFLAIRSATSDETTLEIPVEVRAEEGVAVLSQDPSTVVVTLRGSEEDIANLDRSKIKVVVMPRASDPDEPQETVPIGPGDVEGAPRVRAMDIRPDAVMLTFDRESSRRVAVARPRTIGSPYRGKVELTYEPTNVVIHGAHRGLKDIASLDTQPVDVEGRVQNFTRVVQVLPPPNIWVSAIVPAEVTVRVNIATRLVDRVWTNVAVLAILEPGAGLRASVQPAEVSVSLRGRAEIMDTITNAPFTVLVDCSRRRMDDTNRAPVIVHLPSGLDVAASTVPESVAVNLGPCQ
jgi:YbbR domain-containing protein